MILGGKFHKVVFDGILKGTTSLKKYFPTIRVFFQPDKCQFDPSHQRTRRTSEAQRTEEKCLVIASLIDCDRFLRDSSRNLSKSSFSKSSLALLGLYQRHHHLLLDCCIPVRIKMFDVILSEVFDSWQRCNHLTHFIHERLLKGSRPQNHLVRGILLPNQSRYSLLNCQCIYRIRTTCPRHQRHPCRDESKYKYRN